MSLKGKERCNSDTEVDNEDYDYSHFDKESKKQLDFFIEKLNLGPKKKLLVMNLNGFLLHKVHDSDHTGIPKFRTPDQTAGNFLLYKRPFSKEFMKFCLERFEVGIWSSAMEHNISAALTCVMGSLSSKLLFIWDQKECTNSGFKSLEHKNKPLFFKELNEVFVKIKKRGPYSKSNTLMIDDKPYKAFLNPPNTAIFPVSYKPENRYDKALDPKCELCKYLKELAGAPNVQSFVNDHPIGKPPITSTHPDCRNAEEDFTLMCWPVFRNKKTFF